MIKLILKLKHFHFDSSPMSADSPHGDWLVKHMNMGDTVLNGEPKQTNKHQQKSLTCALVLEIHVSNRSERRLLWNFPVVFTAINMSSIFSVGGVTSAPSEAGCCVADGDGRWATLAATRSGMLARNWKARMRMMRRVKIKTSSLRRNHLLLIMEDKIRTLDFIVFICYNEYLGCPSAVPRIYSLSACHRGSPFLNKWFKIWSFHNVTVILIRAVKKVRSSSLQSLNEMELDGHGHVFESLPFMPTHQFRN